MERYAVLGQPAAHSLSPLMQPWFAQQLGEELEYEAIEVAPEALAATLRRLHEEGYQGCNITLPHKLAVIALCESISEEARIAGAVNVLVRSSTGWLGHNTDGEGLIRDLRQLGFPVRERRVLVLGAGGAARGILKPLLDEEPADLVLSNRNPWKPERIAAEFKAFGPVRPATHQALKGDHFDLVINATSAGHAGEVPRLPDRLLAPGGACYDLTYGPAHAPFRRWAETQGAERIADGLGMLAEQGALSFRLWRGLLPDARAVLPRLREQLAHAAEARERSEPRNARPPASFRPASS